MNSPAHNISISDLERLSKCLLNSFGQFRLDGVLISGETDEENERFMKIYFEIGTYLNERYKISATYDVVKSHIDQIINKQKQYEN